MRALLAVLLGLAACLTGTVDPGAGPLVLRARPDTLRLVVGAIAPLAVEVTDSSGAGVPHPSLDYFSTNDAVVTVTAAGVVAAVAPGTAAIVVIVSGSSTRVPVTVGLTFTALTAGVAHTCGLVPSGALYCWGANARGQLGTGDHLTRDIPARVPGRWTAVAAGGEHTCALAAGGAPHCWGRGGGDQPAAVPGGPFTMLAAGDNHTCGLDAGGAAWCWGANVAGQLGDGTFTGRTAPTVVLGGHQFASVSAGDAHTCALDAAGAAWCWGDNSSGQLAVDTLLTVPQARPVAAAQGIRFRMVAAGHDRFTCGVALDARAWCWGRGSAGQLGIGARATSVIRPRAVGDPLTGDTLRFTQVAAGWSHTCGRADAGGLACWGTSRLGVAGVYVGLSPVPLDGPAAGVALGTFHTCRVTPAGHASCWGGGGDGALGTGDRLSRDMPWPVALQLDESGS